MSVDARRCGIWFQRLARAEGRKAPKILLAAADRLACCQLVGSDAINFSRPRLEVSAGG